MIGKHTTDQPSRWRRRIVGVPVVAWLLGLTVTAAAVVGFFVVLQTQGTQMAAAGINVRWAEPDFGATTAEATAGEPVCTYIYSGQNDVTMDATNIAPGWACTYYPKVLNPGTTGTAALQGFTLGDTELAATGTVVTLDSDCGLTLGPGESAVISVTFSYGTGLTAGTSYSMALAENGLDVVMAADYNPGACS